MSATLQLLSCMELGTGLGQKFIYIVMFHSKSCSSFVTVPFQKTLRIFFSKNLINPQEFLAFFYKT